MNELTSTHQRIMACGAVCIQLGAVLYIMLPVAATIIFCVGVLAFCPMQMLARYEGRNFTIRRLRRQQLLGALALLATAACMAMQTWRFGPTQRNEWVVCMAVACVLELYTAFRIPAELKKEDNKS
ncbi:MAG: hypothetical protein IKS49_08095 [Actinomycetaceae bacterium]|nr:hypothetical protein [Actinomycetaceae bacterium]